MFAYPVMLSLMTFLYQLLVHTKVKVTLPYTLFPVLNESLSNTKLSNTICNNNKKDN